METTETAPIRTALIAFAAAVVLSFAFWQPLWTGGGLIGGDLYSYFFPQKAFYADALQRGEFPLWNDRTGHGYPVLGESQTAALYPPNPLLYRWLDVNSAYNASHVLHYILGFVGMALCAREFGLRTGSALFAALVYVYGWFPARSCLEWAIIGGTWLPWSLLCVERYARTRGRGNLIALSAVLAVQLLAGHYNLAFITQLVLFAYAAVRCTADETEPRTETSSNPSRMITRLRGAAPVWGAIALAFGLAAVQVLPTWELKQHSQRRGVGSEFDPGYGHIPPLYWSQAVAPWLWYGEDVDLDRAISGLKLLKCPSGTNRVEAHLYFGMLSVALLASRFVLRRRIAFRSDGRLRILGWIGLAAFVYTSGWLVPLTRHLPGFGFFMGPGRYGIVATLAVAMLSAATLDDLLRNVRPFRRAVVIGTALFLTASELWYVGRVVGYAVMVERPPILARESSPIRAEFAAFAERGTVTRVFAPGPNLPTITGASATPVYLGLGPQEYYDPALKMPDGAAGPDARAAQIAWLRRAAVTHVLRFDPLDSREWPVRLVWSGFDPLLNPAWARFQEPISLYELDGAEPRAGFAEGEGTATIIEHRPDVVTIEVSSRSGGLLVLRDLAFAGWTATVDGARSETLVHDGMYRAVRVPAGDHRVEWSYRPLSVRLGIGMSGVSAILAIALAFRGAGTGGVRPRGS